MDKRVKTLIEFFFFYLVALVVATIAYNELPLYFHYSLWGQDSFYAGVITNLYSSLLDFLAFSVILFVVLGKHDKNDKVRLYQDNIDDCRYWYSEEAAFRNGGNIRRLQELNVRIFDLSKSTLQNTKLKDMKFEDTRLMGANLDGTNFGGSIFIRSNFQGASAKKSYCNKSKFSDCNFKYADATESQMKSCEFENCDFTKSKLEMTTFHASTFKNCNFEEANLRGCIFERADLRGAMGLTSTQLLSCKSILYVKVDAKIALEINQANPVLLQKQENFHG